MNELSPNQALLRESVKRLCERHVTRELLQRMDRDGEYPYAPYAAWVEAGLIGAAFPEEYGGAGGSVVELATIMEELAYFSYDLCSAYAVVVYTAMSLLKCGTEAQRREWLPQLFSGKRRMSVAISEPEAGSDAAAIRTSAHRDGDAWVIRGQKLWCTAAGTRDNVLQVFARTDPDASPRKGISVFLVPNDTPGVTCNKLDMLGRRGSGTYEIFFDDVRVPATQLLGAPNKGWDYLLACLQTERLTTAAGYVGSSRKVFDLALDFAKTRKQFGRAIGQFQSIAHLLADMQTEIEAGSLLMWRACAKLARGEDALREVTMAKLYCSETYVKSANTGMQIMGAAGYSMEYEMQQHYRDARSVTIGAGTSQMQRNLLAGLMGLKT